jgi:hypothetical protein
MMNAYSADERERKKEIEREQERKERLFRTFAQPPPPRTSKEQRNEKKSKICDEMPMDFRESYVAPIVRYA